MANTYRQNRMPLKQNPYIPLSLGSIQPKGWLEEQLHRMKNGLTGNLDIIYKEVLGERNSWLGGDGDVWERGPYWLDGLVPLAYLLDDEELKLKAQAWIDWTLNSQQANGYFGPKPEENVPYEETGLQRDKAADWWPRMVMLKVLQQYYDATGDQRVIDHMLRYFKYQLNELPQSPLNTWSWWAEQRGGDNLAVIYWLYNLTGDEFLLDLAEIVHQQTYNWINTFLNTDELSKFYGFHCVNIAQAIKEPAIYYQRHPDDSYIEAVKKALRDLELFHGMPNGLFGGDELLHGTDPTHGSELCTAVELMFSLENVIAITGDVSFMDHLERIAFNALPAQSDDNYTKRQYYQQVNQVMVSRHERNFETPHGHTDLCFGVLTGYPCCTVNMHQGWPKFVQSLWYATEDNGLAALIYSSSKVNTIVSGVNVQFTEETNYPFEDTIIFTFNSSQNVSFPFHLRIPVWCRDASVQINGEGYDGGINNNGILIIDRLWANGDEVILKLPMGIESRRWHQGAVAIERGPLVFSLKIDEQWKLVGSTDQYGPFNEVYPGSAWNYGLLEPELRRMKNFPKVINKGSYDLYPWTIANAPLEIRLKAKKLESWKPYNGSAGPMPYSPQKHVKNIAEEEIILVPYGCTKLRITEFPLVQ